MCSNGCAQNCPGCNVVLAAMKESGLYRKLPWESPLDDKYQKLGDPIGEGTYGKVWRARNMVSGDDVAMKLIILRQNGREGFPVSALREIRALKRLDHENIVCLRDVHIEQEEDSIHPGDIYLIFDYAPCDLTGLVQYRKQPLKPQETKCLMKQMLKGLAYCHEKGFLHRDLKPSNVLLSAGGQLKICDFGLSRLQKEVPRNYSRNVITIWYRPPELLLCAPEYDNTVDIWSAGCILGELLLGRPLFPASSEPAIFKLIAWRCEATSLDAWPNRFKRLQLWDKLWRHALPQDGDRPVGHEEIWSHARKRGPAAESLLRTMLAFEPNQRDTAEQCLKHTYFIHEAPPPCDEGDIKFNPALSCHELETRRMLEKAREQRRRSRSSRRR